MLVPVFASPLGGCALCLPSAEHTGGCVQAPVARYGILPWHGRVGALLANLLVLMGLVEKLALQL